MPPVMVQPTPSIIREIYKRLFKKFGPQGWWPGRTRFEIIVGAILTQNTNWKNVEQAIANLRRAGVLTPAGMNAVPVKKLAALIRPAGYFNVKARRLKNFMEFLCRDYRGSLAQMAKEPLVSLRPKLLSVNGIGPETADSILLYAFDRSVFVVDAYTKRFLYRHNLISKGADYHAVQEVFSRALLPKVKMFNEYHALIVRLGKDFCRPHPKCEACPLNNVHYSVQKRCPKCYRGSCSDCQSGA